MRSRLIAVAVLAAALAACTGGGGGGPTTSIPPAPNPAPRPMPAPTPAPNPDPAPTTPETPAAERRGALTAGRFYAKGIERIPLNALKATNEQMRDMFAVIEAVLPYEEVKIVDGVRRKQHLDVVLAVACHSYIRACEDPYAVDDVPYQFHLGVRTRSDDHLQMERVVANLPSTIKIVSISYGGDTPAVLRGASLPFASIESAGNESRDTLYRPGFSENEGSRNVRAAAAADKLLLVAGYRIEGGVYKRSEVSIGCIGEGISESCIWAPDGFFFPEADTVDGPRNNVGGTSASAPHVAASLASVLAVFPDTSPVNLIRLAKACAIPTPSLPGGVGRADFACMTKTGDDGEWRAVTADEFAALLSPDRMSGLVFPGDARITGTFVGRNGKPVTLGARTRGAFGFTGFAAGVPGVSLGRAAGVFPVAADGEGNPSVGFGYMAESGLFAAAAWGSRPGFFGLGKRYGYVNAAAFDASAGHRNAYVRLSRQTSSAPYVRKVRGDALGVTATGTFEVGARTWLTLSAHMDRFLGGRAATAFGPVTIDASPWNGAAQLFAERRIEGGGAVTFTVDRLWPGRGRGETSVKAGYAVRF